ncbi:Uncharacterised protein [Serratia liquefaciens]|nr:Uncharacterised protein [Serratia liquefaciens]
MAHKTKAAMQGRQCHYTKLVRRQNTMQIDQVNRCDFYRFAGGVLTPPLAEFDRVCISGVTGIPVSVGYQALPYTLEYYESFVVQPFGSIPRCCSSLRSMRLIQVARDESPSLRISSSNCERNSSLNRIWYCGDFFSSCIDTCNYPSYHLNVTTRVITFELKSNAPECGNTTEASHQTVNRGNDHG